ncbi:MAG: NUDIX domain-containing protein [Desulfobacteraceae bacterium]|nr:NUDIX domain-containing protein [Desulfobacteraceae bacterium]
MSSGTATARVRAAESEGTLNLKETVRSLENALPDPSQGLPENVFLFVSGVTPLVNVDLLIRDDAGRTLLTWRDDGYYGPGWHVPGGVVRFRESMYERIRAVASSELGAEVSCRTRPIAINEVMHPSRRARGHFISLLFECRLTTPPDDKIKYLQGEPEPGEWAWHSGCPENLIPVHEMYREFF